MESKILFNMRCQTKQQREEIKKLLDQLRDKHPKLKTADRMLIALRQATA